MNDEPAPVPLGRPILGSAPPVDVLPSPSRWRRTGGRRSWISLVLGAWLFVSIFLWPHTRDSWTNTWLVGVLMLGFGALSLYKPMARWVNALLAVWLGISTLAIEHVVGITVWNNVIVALAVLAATLLPIRQITTSRSKTGGS